MESSPAPVSFVRRALFGAEPVEAAEVRRAFWAAAMHGAVLGAWYFIRPVRDELASHHNAVLTALTTATFLTMLIAMPLYAAVVKRLTRRQVAIGVYLFFALVLTAFCVAMWLVPRGSAAMIWIERAFYVFASVFNLFVVSVFWAVAVDVFNERQGRRVFGLVAAGGSLGGIIGSWAASIAVVRVPAASMPLVAAVVIAAASMLVFPLTRDVNRAGHGEPTGEPRIRGTVWAALLATFRSPYLLGISGFLFLYTLTSTFLYFQQSAILGSAISDRAARAVLLARMDLAVNVFTLLMQLFVASRAMLRLGLTFTLGMLPALTIAGFVALAAAPALGVVVGFQVLRRIANFALARPAREVLFTVVPREDKYKAKQFIDTVIYRGGDTASAWMYSVLQMIGLAMSGLAIAAATFSAAWLAVAGYLGAAHRREIRRQDAPEPRGFEVLPPGPRVA